MTITIFLIYRPHNSNLTEFVSGYYSYFKNCPIDDNTIILGDFNIRMNLTIHDTIEFNKILNSLNHKQHIKFPTHILRNRLDLILTLQDSTITSNIHTITIVIVVL